MDMNSRMAMAEKLSVQQLQQAIQSGSLPAYIGIPLIEQKNKEKSQMTAAQQGQQKPPSVASQILQQAEQQQQQQVNPGIDQLPSNLPVAGGEMGMAGGGIIAFADEGQVVDPNAPPVPPAAFSKYGNIPAMSPEGRATFDEYSKELKELRGKGGSEREQAKNMAIFQAGLGIMGGTSPNAFANIAQGAQPAIAQYQQAAAGLRKEDRDTLKQMLDLGVSKEQFLQKAQQMGIDVYKADKAYDAQIRAAGIAAASRGTKEPRAITTAELDQQEVARAAKLLMQQNPNMSQEQAESQAYRDVLKIRHPDPSNLAGVGALAGAENTAIVNDPGVINAAKALQLATYSQDDTAIKKAQDDLNTAKQNAQKDFRERVPFIMGVSNRPAGGGANPPAAGANPPPAGASGSTVNAPSLPDFLAAARKANPGVSDEQLKAYYKQKYGR
jgi:hypothetical protein